jgi:hypothetical protein
MGDTAAPAVKQRGKVHYVWDSTSGYTLCGRYVTFTVRATKDPRKITCSSCRGSRALDPVFGNMTWGGHD